MAVTAAIVARAALFGPAAGPPDFDQRGLGGCFGCGLCDRGLGRSFGGSRCGRNGFGFGWRGFACRGYLGWRVGRWLLLRRLCRGLLLRRGFGRDLGLGLRL